MSCFIVCDEVPAGPYQPSHYDVILDGKPVVTVEAVAGVAPGSKMLKYDVGGVVVGVHKIEVIAVYTDPIWGRLQSASVPLDFTKPGIPLKPANVRLSQ